MWNKNVRKIYKHIQIGTDKNTVDIKSDLLLQETE